jgi:transposase
MPQPYSADLRERVLVACERGDSSQVEIAHRFQVCPATVSNWRRQAREESRRQSKPHSGGVPSRLDTGTLAGLRQLVAEDNDALLREYRERLAERTGVRVCLAVIWEALKRLKLRPKKRRFGRPSRTGPRSRLSVRLTPADDRDSR